MFRHKIFGLFQTFSPEEVKRFGEFIRSPYFNRRANTIKLYDEIMKYYPSFNNVRLSRKILYKTIFNSADYNDSTLRVLIANLQNLAQKFLAIQNFTNEKLGIDIYILEELMLRNQHDLFLKNVKKINQYTDKIEKVDFDYLYSRYKLERNKFNFGVLNDKIIRKTNAFKQIETIYNTCNYLTIYYVTELIGMYINLFIFSEKINAGQVTIFINNLLASVNVNKISVHIKNKNEYDFMLDIYAALMKTFLEMDNTANYNVYKNLIKTNTKKLSSDELSFHYSALVCYCILQELKGGFKKTFSEELMQLYESILKNEYYKNKKENYLPPALFRGMLFLARRLNRLDMISKMIKEYANRLNPKEKYNMIRFGYAFYYFESGDYEKSIEFINKIRIDYFIYKYDVKNLNLRIYYELGYFEECLSLIHAYREFLRKDEFLSDLRKLRHRNFVAYLEKLVLYRMGSYKGDINFLRVKLVKAENVSHINWLIKKFQ